MKRYKAVVGVPAGANESMHMVIEYPSRKKRGDPKPIIKGIAITGLANCPKDGAESRADAKRIARLLNEDERAKLLQDKSEEVEMLKRIASVFIGIAKEDLTKAELQVVELFNEAGILTYGRFNAVGWAKS